MREPSGVVPEVGVSEGRKGARVGERGAGVSPSTRCVPCPYVPAFSEVGRAAPGPGSAWALFPVGGSRVAPPGHSCCARPHPERRAGGTEGQGGPARNPPALPSPPPPRAARLPPRLRGRGRTERRGREARRAEGAREGGHEGEGEPRSRTPPGGGAGGGARGGRGARGARGRARERGPPRRRGEARRGEGRGRVRIDGRSRGGISIPGAKLELEGRRRRAGKCGARVRAGPGPGARDSGRSRGGASCERSGQSWKNLAAERPLGSARPGRAGVRLGVPSPPRSRLPPHMSSLAGTCPVPSARVP